MPCACRRATGAVQKLPQDWKQKVDEHHKRMAHTVMVNKIPAKLVVSADETLCWYISMGSASTFDAKGVRNLRAACALKCGRLRSFLSNDEKLMFQ